jgi:hypothetical protein
VDGKASHGRLTSRSSAAPSRQSQPAHASESESGSRLMPLLLLDIPTAFVVLNVAQ